MSLPQDILACPACGAPSPRQSETQTSCFECGARFPNLGSLPCLVPEPVTARGEWRRQVAEFEATLTSARLNLEMALSRFDLPSLSRRRLEALRQANIDNATQVLGVLSTAGLAGESINQPPGVAGASLTEHYELLLRDWAWERAGNEENAEAMARMERIIGERRDLGRVAVLGAGAGRLAYDIHLAYRPEFTVAVDINPLLLLLAQRVVVDGELKLTEFSLVPDGIQDVVREWVLTAPTPNPSGFHLLLADAFSPPFVANAFDTIVTPWFIDVAPEDIKETIGLIHELLTPQGRWLNSGPLIFPVERQAVRRYCKEEVMQLVEWGGFELQLQHSEQVGYLCSPCSGHSRRERVLSFSAAKRPLQARRTSPESSEPPAWLVLPHLPIPVFAGLRESSQSHPLLCQVQGLINDERSLDDLAQAMVDAQLLPENVIPRDATAALVMKLYQECSGDSASKDRADE